MKSAFSLGGRGCDEDDPELVGAMVGAKAESSGGATAAGRERAPTGDAGSSPLLLLLLSPDTWCASTRGARLTAEESAGVGDLSAAEGRLQQLCVLLQNSSSVLRVLQSAHFTAGAAAAKADSSS